MAARTYIVGRLRSAHHGRDMILRLSLLKRNNMSFDLFAVYDQLFNAFLYTVRVLNVDVVAGAAEGTVRRKSPKPSGMHGSIPRPSYSGCTPRIACEIFTKVHAAVPVSQLFFASPKNLASAPATI